jgi:RimJ/RimL family protein N-acetyltransferase/catechol 2,3-dioxygenase-like lactoylglutathione lyase family enzyme
MPTPRLPAIPPTLETARLRLEPAGHHGRALFDLFDDPTLTPETGWKRHPNPDYTATVYRPRTDAASPEWAMVRRPAPDAPADAPPHIVGLVAVHVALVTGMGYLVHRDMRGHGYAREGAAAVLGWLFTEAAISTVELWVNSRNTASQRVAYALGFRPRAQFDQKLHASIRSETLVFGLRAEEWAEAHGRPSAVLASSPMPFYSVEPVIGVRDVAALVAWYRDVLGFAITWIDDEQAPTFAIVSRGEWSFERVSLHLAQRESDAPPGELFVPVGADAHTLYAELSARGAHVGPPPVLAPYGRLIFTVTDPLGWRLTFASAP